MDDAGDFKVRVAATLLRQVADRGPTADGGVFREAAAAVTVLHAEYGRVRQALEDTSTELRKLDRNAVEYRNTIDELRNEVTALRAELAAARERLAAIDEPRVSRKKGAGNRRGA